MVATSANATRFSTRNRKSEREFAQTTTDWSPHGGNPVGFAQEVVQPQSPSGGIEEEGFFLPLGDLFLPVHALLALNELQQVVTQQNLDPCSWEPITFGHDSSSQVPEGELKGKVLEGRSESCKTETKDPANTVGEVSCTGHPSPPDFGLRTRLTPPFSSLCVSMVGSPQVETREVSLLVEPRTAAKRTQGKDEGRGCAARYMVAEACSSPLGEEQGSDYTPETHAEYFLHSLTAHWAHKRSSTQYPPADGLKLDQRNPGHTTSSASSLPAKGRAEACGREGVSIVEILPGTPFPSLSNFAEIRRTRARLGRSVVQQAERTPRILSSDLLAQSENTISKAPVVKPNQRRQEKENPCLSTPPVPCKHHSPHPNANPSSKQMLEKRSDAKDVAIGMIVTHNPWRMPPMEGSLVPLPQESAIEIHPSQATESGDEEEEEEDSYLTSPSSPPTKLAASPTIPRRGYGSGPHPNLRLTLTVNSSRTGASKKGDRESQEPSPACVRATKTNHDCS